MDYGTRLRTGNNEGSNPSIGSKDGLTLVCVAALNTVGADNAWEFESLTIRICGYGIMAL